MPWPCSILLNSGPLAPGCSPTPTLQIRMAQANTTTPNQNKGKEKLRGPNRERAAKEKTEWKSSSPVAEHVHY